MFTEGQLYSPVTEHEDGTVEVHLADTHPGRDDAHYLRRRGEIAGAGHASATGRFDDEQLFYLRARGIPEEQARRLVVRGFFNEIIAKIAVPAVRERLTEAIEKELAITEASAN